MKIKFRRKANGQVLEYDTEKDKAQIKTLRMSTQFQELVNLGG